MHSGNVKISDIEQSCLPLTAQGLQAPKSVMAAFSRMNVSKARLSPMVALARQGKIKHFNPAAINPGCHLPEIMKGKEDFLGDAEM
jgi:hypothetical protein